MDYASVFKLLDNDQDGQLTFRDLCFAFEERNIKWDIDDAKKTFKALDPAKRRAISKDEFATAMEKNEGIPHVFKKKLDELNQKPLQMKKLNITPKKSDEPEKEANLESIISSLNTRDADWRFRVTQLQRLTEVVGNLSDDEFSEQWEAISFCLSEQLQDRRSTLIPHACEAVPNILQSRTHLNPDLSIYKTLCQCIRMKVKVISNAAIECAGNLLNNFGAALLPELQLALKEKHGIVRQTSLDLVASLLKRNKEIQNWDDIEEIILSGISDADPGARKSCGKILKLMESKFRAQFDIFYAKQTGAQKKRIDRARGVKRKRQGLKISRKPRKRQKDGVVA